ncbi:MAG: hypothetical protein ACRC8S_12350 [Fimbriiglobus sp.]
MQIPALSAATRVVSEQMRESLATLTRDAEADDRLFAIALVSDEDLTSTMLYWAYENATTQRLAGYEPKPENEKLYLKWSPFE